MRLLELFRLVWINIAENKFKVVLTSLGIIVGAATIVLVIAIGRGGRMDVEDQFKNLSAGAVDVVYAGQVDIQGMMGQGGFGAPGGQGAPGGNPRGGGRGGQTRAVTVNKNQVTLDEGDVEEILLFLPDVADATISASGRAAVSGGNLEEETQYTVAGVKPEYANISNLSLQVGDFLTDADDENESKVCVLGHSLAGELFDSALDAYDSVIYLDGRSFTVCGVLAQMGSVASGISPDSAIFLPYSSARKYVFGNSLRPTLTVVASDVGKVAEVSENLEVLLTASYPGASFTITDAGGKMQAATKSADTLSMLLIAVASIVFVVGGIGIMNVLFVSVQERTREIGILKALGSSKRDILLEFLLESNMISTFGGVAGIALSYAVMPLMKYTGMRVEPSTAGAVLALFFAIFTGTVFGFYPACKASRLVPVDALNTE